MGDGARVGYGVTRLASRRVLLPDGRIAPATVTIGGALIAAVGPWSPAQGATDLGDRLLAPGLIDVHGDAFERQVMPRPGVAVDPAVGLLDTDRQLVANGITTAFHGLTWSWEPGLRGTANGHLLIDTLDRLRPALACDHRWHLRFEAFNLDGLDEALALVRSRRVGMVAFNDHTPSMAEAALKPTGNIGNAYRALVPVAEFNALALAAHARAAEVEAGMARLAAAAREAGVPLLSHDDASPAERARFRALGASVCEFPKTLATAEDAAVHGEEVVMGAPNVLRGKSQFGWLSAGEAAARGSCTVLASDYYYPAMLQAPYRLSRAEGGPSLGEAWRLVSTNAARCAGLADRGAIAPGLRADLIVVEDDRGLPPRVVATLVGGTAALEVRSPAAS
jgi:alpha-D-ribose 1-methylphosphonate 5-triphosphate diphosphatase